MPILTTQQIEAAFSWGRPEEKQTKRGDRILRKAPVTSQAEAFYRANRTDLSAAGVMLGEWPPQSGRWSFSWFQEIPRAELAQREENKVLSRATDADVVIPCPAGMVLYPFQKAGVAFCARQFSGGRGGVLLADAMGLGKTCQAISVINCDPTIALVLIVAPATLKLNWQSELRSWLVRPMTIGIADAKTWPSTEIIIVNYDVVHKWPRKMSTLWDLVILDECQRIKSRKARRSKAILGYIPGKKEPASDARAPIPARRKLLLTGTPIENRPDEAWTLLHFIDPCRWPSYWKFAARYCGLENNGFGVAIGDGRNLDELNNILRSSGTMIRRLKSEVLTELPPKTRTIIQMEVDSDDEILLRERSAYNEDEDEEIEAEYELAKAGTEEEFNEASKKLQHRRDSRLARISELRHATALAKVTRLGLAETIAEDVREIGKAVIFGHHKDVLAAVVGAFKRHEVVLVTGETPLPERDAAVRRFQTDPTCLAFVGSIRACGEGITLTASQTVIFVEEDWTPGKMVQAEDRCHRLTQKGNVLCQHYVVNGSLDARMIETVVRKQAVIDQVLDARPVAAEPVPYVNGHAKKQERVSTTRDELTELAAKLDDRKIERIHQALKALAEMCDGAREQDGHGFNKFDSRIGKELAQRLFLTPRQAALGAKICFKYVRQIGDLRHALSL